MPDRCPKCHVLLTPGLDQCPSCGERINTKEAIHVDIPLAGRDMFWFSVYIGLIALFPLIIGLLLGWMCLSSVR